MASFFRKVTANWKLKVMAFALAVLLWTVVSAEQITTNWIWVPLEIQVADPDFRPLPPEVRDVQVRFTGPGRDLLDLAVRRPPLRLRIDSVDEEQEVFRLEPGMVQVPGQLAVSALDVRPATVRLEFTRLDSRIVPVRIRATDLTGSGWVVVDTLTADPDRVRISGPAGRLAGVTEIGTVPVDLAPTDTLVERTVALDTTQLQGVDLSTRQVTVTGRVDRLVERSIPNVRIDVGPGIGISPEQVEVQLRGPESVVSGITPADFRVVVSIDEIPMRVPEAGVAVPLRIDRLRPGVEVTLNPPQVRLLPGRPAIDTISLPGVPAERDTVVADLPS